MYTEIYSTPTVIPNLGLLIFTACLACLAFFLFVFKIPIVRERIVRHYLWFKRLSSPVRAIVAIFLAGVFIYASTKPGDNTTQSGGGGSLGGLGGKGGIVNLNTNSTTSSSSGYYLGGGNLFDELLGGTGQYDIQSIGVLNTEWVPYNTNAVLSAAWNMSPVETDPPLEFSLEPGRVVFGNSYYNEGLLFLDGVLGLGAPSVESPFESPIKLSLFKGSLYFDPSNALSRIWTLNRSNNSRVVSWENMRLSPSEYPNAQTNLLSLQLEVFKNYNLSFRYKLDAELQSMLNAEESFGEMISLPNSSSITNWFLPILTGGNSSLNGVSVNLNHNNHGVILGHSSAGDGISDFLKEAIGYSASDPININAPSPIHPGRRIIDDMVSAFEPQTSYLYTEVVITVAYYPTSNDGNDSTMITVGPLILPVIPWETYTTTQRLENAVSYPVNIYAAPDFKPENFYISILPKNWQYSGVTPLVVYDPMGLFHGVERIDLNASGWLAIPVVDVKWVSNCIHPTSGKREFTATVYPDIPGEFIWKVKEAYTNQISFSSPMGDTTYVSSTINKNGTYDETYCRFDIASDSKKHILIFGNSYVTCYFPIRICYIVVP